MTTTATSRRKHTRTRLSLPSLIVVAVATVWVGVIGFPSPGLPRSPQWATTQSCTRNSPDLRTALLQGARSSRRFKCTL